MISDSWLFENVFVLLLAGVYSVGVLKALSLRVSRQAATCRQVHNDRRRISYEDQAG